MKNNFYNQLFSLEKKKIIIVGGFGLIGQEIVVALGSLGAELVVLDNFKDINFLKKTERLKLNVKFIYFDCTNLKKLEKNFLNIFTKNFTPSILINCSYPRTKDWSKNTFKEINIKSYQQNISFHLNSYVWLSKIFAEKIKKNKLHGKIINFGSIYGFLGQDLNIYKNTKMKENLSYSVIKGGIINLTRQMASYYGKYNILVNTICPGGVYGPVQGLLKKQEKIFLKNYSNKVPIGRLAFPYEIASVIAFLSSDGSSYITGSCIVVDGGWSII